MITVVWTLQFCAFSPWYNRTGWLGVEHQVTYWLKLLVCFWRLEAFATECQKDYLLLYGHIYHWCST